MCVKEAQSAMNAQKMLNSFQLEVMAERASAKITTTGTPRTRENASTKNATKASSGTTKRKTVKIVLLTASAVLAATDVTNAQNAPNSTRHRIPANASTALSTTMSKELARRASQTPNMCTVPTTGTAVLSRVAVPAPLSQARFRIMLPDTLIRMMSGTKAPGTQLANLPSTSTSTAVLIMCTMTTRVVVSAQPAPQPSLIAQETLALTTTHALVNAAQHGSQTMSAHQALKRTLQTARATPKMAILLYAKRHLQAVVRHSTRFGMSAFVRAFACLNPLLLIRALTKARSGMKTLASATINAMTLSTSKLTKTNA